MPRSLPPHARTYIYYVILLIMFAAGIFFILARGSSLRASLVDSGSQSFPASPSSSTVSPSTAPQSYFSKVLRENLRSPLSILLLQIIVIIILARSFAVLFRRIGQPPVMGEIVAGLVLGPSVLGWLSPPTLALLFPSASLTTLSLLSQVGVVLFMFVVGMELDIQYLRTKASAAIMISHASIVVPFLMGAALALFIYTPLAPAKTSFTAFALFMGIAMSITAFPVLARILEDRGLAKTNLGSTAIACAAVDDATAWCILAIVIAIVKSSGVTASLVTILLVLLFVGVLLFGLKPRIATLITTRVEKKEYGKGLLAGIVALVLACAWVTESLGIHALFGAFLAGIVMPPAAHLRSFLREKLESFSSAALLPLFFAFIGLRTEIRLLNDWAGWLMCLAIIVVAVAGKLGGSMLMARWTRMSWRDSLAIGVLMNTRGLIELVILNIGYDLGILSARIFVMMVIMALVTTFMTAPLLSILKPGKQA
ncbi:MAG TPA: cation:proton antiporter [Pyrinomonadaceae bacterium]|nr:cation:proton antiporter [Pyrinomonadaceae bacterium]